jgi:uncharacterized protein (TIGR02001 family)
MEISSNLGFASEYYYRGVFQAESSANGGMDISHNQWSGGFWLADVGDGLELDLYGQYQLQVYEQLTASIGFTHYHYTGEFDETYKEINLAFQWHFVELEYADGEWEGGSLNNNDYRYAAITITQGNFYGKYGVFSDEFDGDYFEFGYQGEIESFNYSLGLIISSEELSDQLDGNGNPAESEALVFSVSKSFDL